MWCVGGVVSLTEPRCKPGPWPGRIELLYLDNIYHSTGGSTVFLGDSKDLLGDTLKNIRHGKSLTQWMEFVWMPLYHSDPSGIVFMEYTTDDDSVKPYPTYKSIHNIRNYIPKGQKLEVLLFEPKTVKDDKKVWRVVDDRTDWRVLDSV